jgi:uncharacterized membrane protein
LDAAFGAFDLYSILLFLHITGAIVWVGGAVTLQVLAVLIIRTNDLNRLVAFAAETEFVGTRIFVPASLVVVLCGIGLVLKGSWGFDHIWVALALAAFAFSFVSGTFYISPQTAKTRALLVANNGEPNEAVAQRINNILRVSRIELVILVFIVFLMVFKPGA